MQEYSSTQARGAFADVSSSSSTVEVEPRLIGRRDRQAAAVVSHDDIEAGKTGLRDYLLTAGYAEDHDAFDDALASIRESGSTIISPRAATLGA